MRHRLMVAAAVMLAPGLIAAPVPAATDTGSAQFIQSLGNQALEVVRSTMPPAQKLAYFHQLLHRDFNLREISRFVLGPYWRSASEDQRQGFVRLLEDDIIGFYRRQFTRYDGESFRVTGAREVPGGTIVTSQILRPDGAPIAVDWRLREHDGFYKISDVVIDGVSMVLNERYTLAEQIQANGGQVSGLLRQIQQQGLTGSSSPR